MKTRFETNRSRLGRKVKRAAEASRPSHRLSAAARSAQALKLKRILVPVDFSEASLKALTYAVPFAERFGATIHLVHVIEPSFLIGDAGNLARAVPQRELAENAKEKLLSLAS